MGRGEGAMRWHARERGCIGRNSKDQHCKGLHFGTPAMAGHGRMPLLLQSPQAHFSGPFTLLLVVADLYMVVHE